ncbi:uncharacterized protein Z520_02016 [Fonsecaea multimorphosa CBS 102226]|uniref:Uncharacterized protein n=1 Tax=Fonsecaea multimorphosa CBS 102226 TaxID=1442371 RepID=A0A0D2K7E2_9EURO|nr:uncharacterized protein Z520_02016 [Fonsecaea multimorphosa CBS 102226]KIY01878.1 hypothetical protein Z520_02016 [Fonsecaea multimorphosa CBS 102226]OAL29563.1 hypothetical protein AYO22_01977 [Fonsecaea multimorphosa]
MSSRQSQGHHDPNTCPEVQERLSTEAAVYNVVQEVRQIPQPQRGASQYLNTRLADLAKSADLMVTEDAEDIDTIFETVLQARMFRQALLPNKRGTDTTIPETQEQFRAHVKVLFKAFKCVPDECGCQDAIKRPFRNQIHDNYLVECLCWEILEACIERSRKEANLVDAWEPGKFKYKKAHDLTFEERFDSIVETMATSKTICKHLFDVKYLLKVVDDPKTNAERVEANRKLNGLKARVMKRGKEAEAEDNRRAKRVKTEAPKNEEGDADDSPSVKQRPHCRSRASSAETTAEKPVATPTRPPLPTVHPSSVPANMSMAPPAMYHSRYPRSFQSSPLPHSNNVFDLSPSGHGSPTGMFGNPYRPAYSASYGQRMQTPSPMQRNVLHQISPMLAPGYATASDSRYHPTHTMHSSRSASRASTRHSNPTTPSDQGSSYHSWLSQPVQDNHGISSSYSSSYSSGASTVMHESFAHSADENPQWDHSYNSGLGALADAATTFGDNDGIRAEKSHGNINMSDLLTQEEAAHTNGQGGSTESEHEEDAEYEDE